ncbi:MAG: ABC transporter permease [Balneola sp.]|nr:ABC transporter permease [Balneola sp.]MBO6649711.1 ABC transporter permease [Balneola sp.]MBO6712273.1 ABC transporter permease [Balneola sp.]MBO6800467.1 ABC transporter permease [Balneola sp.]MBO6871421.1 ABC transporter permease [Balneola sp.]
MHYTGQIAQRYLFSKKHISLISTLTFISIIGVTIGTALLIVVLSVLNGFFGVVKGYLLNYDPDLRVEASGTRVFNQNQGLISQIESLPEVTLLSSYVEGKALLTNNGNENKVVELRGVETESFIRLIEIEQSIKSGLFDVSVRNGKPGLVINEQLRNELDLELGDEVALLSASAMRRTLTQITAPRLYRFEVRGSYELEQIGGGAQIFIDITAAQRLFKSRKSISGIDIKITDSELAPQLKPALQSKLGTDYKVSSWYDLQKALYDVMYLEKWGAYAILMIIIIVAVLNIVGSLTMIVIQKRRDIGILITMGYSKAAIKKIFRKQGLYIGLIGCIFGGALGLLLSWMQLKFHIIKLSTAFLIDAYPVQIQFTDVAIILGGSLFLCIAASWMPATRASEVQPADAIRYE